MRGLRRIRATINGSEVTLLTVGYVAHALGRTVWTVHDWTRLNLLPQAPFVINPEVPRTRRHLWPEAYVDALAEIARRLRIGARMNRDQWMHFHALVRSVHEDIVVPLLPEGVSGTVELSAVQVKRGRVKTITSEEVPAISPLSPPTAPTSAHDRITGVAGTEVA